MTTEDIYSSEGLESILLETLAQLEEVQSKHKRESLAFFSTIEHDKARPIKISGIALAEGDWNGVRYEADEIKSAGKSLLGLPLRVEHSRTEEFKSTEIGKVTFVAWDDVLRALKFEATITDVEATRLVINGTFKAVSVQTFVDRVPTKTVPVAKNLTFVELSLVEQPACETCHIFHWESLAKRDPRSLSIGEDKLEKEEEMLSTTEELSEEELDSYLKKYGDKYPYTYPHPKYYGAIKKQLDDIEKRLAAVEKKVMKASEGEKKEYPYKEYPYPEKKLSEEELDHIANQVLEYVKSLVSEALAKKPSEYPERGGVVCPVCGPPPEGPTLANKAELIDHIKQKHPEEYDKMKKAGKLAKAKDMFEIKEEDDKFVVYCKETGKKLKAFDSKEEAQKYIDERAKSMAKEQVKYIVKKEDDKFVVYGVMEDEEDKKIKEFDTEEEAKAFIKEKYPEKKSGCPEDTEDLAFPKAYTDFMKVCMKEKKDMKACYQDYVKKSKADPEKYPPLTKAKEEKAQELDLFALEAEQGEEVKSEMEEEIAPESEAKEGETPEAAPETEEPAAPEAEIPKEPEKIVERIIERIIEKPVKAEVPPEVPAETPPEEIPSEPEAETPEEPPAEPEKDPLDDLSIGELIHVLYRRKEEE